MTTTFTVTSHAVEWLTGDREWDTWESWLTEALGEFAVDYDVEKASGLIAEAYDALLPEGMFLVGNFIYAEADLDWDLEQAQAEVREAAGEVDVWAIVRECEITTP